MKNVIKPATSWGTEVAKAKAAHEDLEKARLDHDRAQRLRAQCFAEASAAGAPNGVLASETGITRARVGQIIAGATR